MEYIDNIPIDFLAIRTICKYHSWSLDEENFGEDICKTSYCTDPCCVDRCTVYKKIKEANIVSQAEWEEYGHNLSDNFIYEGIRCSKCHTPARLKEHLIENPPVIRNAQSYELTAYCPDCGARMELTKRYEGGV